MESQVPHVCHSLSYDEPHDLRHIDVSTTVSAEDPDEGHILDNRLSARKKDLRAVFMLHSLVKKMNDQAKIEDQEEKNTVTRASQALGKALEFLPSSFSGGDHNVELPIQDMENAKYWITEKAKTELDSIQGSESATWTQDDLKKLRERTAACYEAVWLWPPLQTARQLKWMTSTPFTRPMKGLLWYGCNDAWDPDENCRCPEYTHGAPFSSQHIIEAETGQALPTSYWAAPSDFDPSCLSVESTQAQVISNRLKTNFLSNLAIQESIASMERLRLDHSVDEKRLEVSDGGNTVCL
jgi:hypothetical protein